MMLTLCDVKERLKDIDEVELLDHLGLTSEDLINRFEDVIELRLEKLRQVVDWED